MGDVVQGDYRMSQMSTVLGVTMLLNMRFVGFSRASFMSCYTGMDSTSQGGTRKRHNRECEHKFPLRALLGTKRRNQQLWYPPPASPPYPAN